MWRIPETDLKIDTLMARAAFNANENLPEYHTRQKRKAFTESYGKRAKFLKPILSCVYKDLTGNNSAPSDEKERGTQEHIAKFILTFCYEQWHLHAALYTQL